MTTMQIRTALVVGLAVAATMLALTPNRIDAAEPSATTFAMIGDSITWQATAHLESAIPGVRISSDFGRPFSHADAELTKVLEGGTPDVLIIALGTNPPMSLAQVDAFMERTVGIERVVFVNIRIPRDWEAQTNDLINSLPHRFSKVSVVDWYTYSNARTWVFNPSGFHLSEAGKPEFANLVAAGAFEASGGCDAPTQTHPNSAGIGVVDPSQGLWYLRDPLTTETTSFYYGNPGDVPFTGDWDGDGVDTPGLYRQSDGYVYLRNSNTQGVADVAFFFGNPGDVPVPGDFNGNGFDTVSLYRPSEARFYVINKLGAGDAGLGAADTVEPFGNLGDRPIAGRVGASGTDTIGVHREASGLVAFATAPTTSIAFGDPGDQLVIAPFGGGPTDAIGVFRPRTAVFYLRSTTSPQSTPHIIGYGRPGYRPIAGFFGALAGGSLAPGPTPCQFTK